MDRVYLLKQLALNENREQLRTPVEPRVPSLSEATQSPEIQDIQIPGSRDDLNLLFYVFLHHKKVPYRGISYK